MNDYYRTRPLLDALAMDGWALATRLIDDGVARPSDYLRDGLAEVDRLGAEHDHLMRFWASPDARWFWEMAASLERVVLVTDVPAEASRFLGVR